MRKPGCNGGVCFCNTENYCNDRHAVRKHEIVQNICTVHVIMITDICSGYQGASRVSLGAASRQVGQEVYRAGGGERGPGPGQQRGPPGGGWHHDGDIMGPGHTDMEQITRLMLITSAASNNHEKDITFSSKKTYNAYTNTHTELLMNENHNIAFAMSSLHADPVLGLNILRGWLEGCKYLNQRHCPGWEYLNV